MKARRFLICVVAALAFVAATRPAEAQIFRRLWRPARVWTPRSFAPQNWAPPSAPIAPPRPFDAEAEARAVEAEINAVRERNGLRPLVFDAELAAGSSDWSAVMARAGDCFHGASPFPEICAAWQETPRFAVKCWFDSGGHRDEMLNPYYARVGAGVAVDRWGRRYWTARFR